MPDNLRDRIAAVLYGNLRRQQGIDRPDRFLDWIDTSELADAVMKVIQEENDDIRPALREALASWGDEKLSLDQTFELHEKGCVCDDCLPDDID